MLVFGNWYKTTGQSTQYYEGNNIEKTKIVNLELTTLLLVEIFNEFSIVFFFFVFLHLNL